MTTDRLRWLLDELQAGGDTDRWIEALCPEIEWFLVEYEKLRRLEQLARQVAEFKRGGSDVLADDAVDVLCRWCEEHPQ